MWKKLVLAVGAVLCLACPASAQFASPWTWGATMPMFEIALDDSIPDRTTFLEAGAGVFFAGNAAPTQDGRWRMITGAVALFMNYENGLTLAPAFTVGTLNNLLSVGVKGNLVKDGEGVGDFFSRENVSVVISAALNFGSGGPGNEQQQRALGAKEAAGETFHSRPPGYVGW